MKSDRDANLNDEILVEIRKTANNTLPVVLEKEFIPSVPSAEKEATIYLTLANVSFLLFLLCVSVTVLF